MKQTLIVPNDIEINTQEPSSDFFQILDVTASQTTRGGVSENQVEVENDDVIEFELEDGSIWIGPVDELPEILGIDDGMDPSNRGNDKLTLRIPSRIKVEGEDQRGLGEFLKIIGINFFKKKAAGKLASKFVSIAAQKLDKHLQPKEGLYAVGLDMKLTLVSQPLERTDEPILLFLHGTATTFHGSFDKMLASESRALWTQCQKEYTGRMYALQHYTLTKSPIDNVLDLVSYLPDNATVHVISQSRGGLVGDLLSLFHSDNLRRGIPELELAQLNSIESYKNSADKLNSLILRKRINVEKFVRVACPGLGTHLCSENLDKFFKILLNSIAFIAPQSAAVTKAIKEVLLAILACKEDSDVIPGIEAMSPFSTYTKVMASDQLVVNAPLNVVCGNSTLNFSWKAIVTIIARTIFRGKNDWIVDTTSMSYGIHRGRQIGHFFYTGSDIHHFHYFLNPSTQNAISMALSTPSGQIPMNFQAWSRMDVEAQRGKVTGSYQTPPVTGDKPVLIVIPGILGSNLSIEQDGRSEEIYIDLWKLKSGGMKRLAIGEPNIKATSLIGMAYREFGDHFKQYYDVSAFPYDWRLSIEEEAYRLAGEISSVLDKVKDHPIRIVAHSMGGLLLRHFMFKHTDVWKRLNERDGFKLIFLGSPLGGSYLVPEVLVGEGDRINQLALLDFTSKKETLLSYFAKYPGLLHLLPISETPYDFTKQSTWDDLKSNWDKIDWTVPNHQIFKEFKDEVLSFDTNEFRNSNIFYIAGKAPETINNYYFKSTRRKGRGLEFTTTPEGDGSVTWSTGIPKEMGSGQVYYVRVTHGKLLDERDIFSGIHDLLERGKTSEFSASPIVDFSKKGLWSKITGRGGLQATSNEELASGLLGMKDQYNQQSNTYTNHIQVSLYCSDLTYAKHPMLLAHLDSEALYGAEVVVDKLLNGALSNRINLGVFPRNIGESSIITDVSGKHTFLIAGLGQTDKVSATTVTTSLSSALLKYALLEIEQNAGKTKDILQLELSSLLLGSNYIGLSVYQAIESVIEAIVRTNQLLMNNRLAATFSSIEFFEIIEDKACQAFLQLKKLAKSKSYVSFDQVTLHYKEGYRERYAQEEHTDWWHRMQVVDKSNMQNFTGQEPVIDVEYTFSEGLARAKREYVSISMDTLRAIFERMSVDHRWTHELALALYNRLIPYSFREDFKRQQNLLITLDEITAQFPWELIHNADDENKPYTTQVGLIRQLSSLQYRERVQYAKNKKVLIIGDPELEGWEMYQQLEGARKEAETLNVSFLENGFETIPVINEIAFETSVKVNAGSYQILHYSGHGHFNPDNRNESGLVIGKNKFIRPADIKCLDQIPELVFINACYAGQVNPMAEKQAANRYQLSANIGTELIRLGVKAVVVAGWAVNDALALLFAETFYTEMFSGATFSEAIQAARKTVYDKDSNSNTWGAYQAYGDEHFRLNQKSKTGSRHQSMDQFDLPQFMNVELRNLLSMKDFSMTKSQKIGRLKQLEEIIWKWPSIPTVTFELFALNYEKLRIEEEALKMFALMRKAPDAKFYAKSLEIELKLRRKRVQKMPVTDQTLAELDQIITDLESLLLIYPSAERYSLIGGTYKVKAKMLHQKASKKSEGRVDKPISDDIVASIKKSAENYHLAVDAAPANTTAGIYPLVNAIVVEKIVKVLSTGTQKSKKFDESLFELLGEMFNSVKATFYDPNNYWDKMLECNILFAKFLHGQDQIILNEFRKKLSSIWDTDGSFDDKQIEIEHLETIVTLLSGYEGFAGPLNGLLSWMKSIVK
jgi:CHAT domain-containing protein/pimeloyl-ACP methyl ester carboxylesterase